LIRIKALAQRFGECSAMRIMVLPLLIPLLAATAATAQTRSGDATRGAQLAQRQCAECHLTRDTPSGTRPAVPEGVPTFHAIANDPRITDLGLQAFLQTPHATMPNIVLSRREIDDAIAYIRSHQDK
jgi:mono/diheme cytochrome c family protein